jgi:hypothetical protein
MADGVPYIGSLISLISKAEIRYEGDEAMTTFLSWGPTPHYALRHPCPDIHGGQQHFPAQREVVWI